ncbi:hypothetical protein [Cellvibrio japonicus]|nr:hypothetical protein [Cellvibrio japonicus]QEI11603.1 hypothetical protein FY117_04745 [Cellvibrio japonicus]QEI15177.1 hypothetical protein FY116_04745 [Cellvibrio japonicus]QEI18757.1 hypothetical protein FY115_04745 [Cellvibrio japonicus]
MGMDKLKQHRVSKTNNNQEAIAFNQRIGARMSAMEHLVPEQMFSTETDKAQGISAVKALAIASQQGQKIWTINKTNLNLALSRVNLGADAENDIRNAVNAGKIATAHENRINFNGWVGEGYILMDPKTGAGAYMISGGGNGGFLSKAMFWLGAFIGFLESKPIRGLLFDGLLAGIGAIVGAVLNIVELMSKCHMGFAIAVTIILLIVTIIFEALLIMSGVGFFLGLLLGVLLGRLESMFVDHLLATTPLCNQE